MSIPPAGLPRWPAVGRRGREERTVFKIIACSKCNVKEKRVFREGDYITEVDLCAKCGVARRITLIYSEQVGSI